jgi:ATP-binding cassette subfamily C (CFTR/MRP) protein 4
MQCRLINNTFKMYVTKCCIFLVILVTTLCGTPLTPQYLFALITLYEGIKATVTVSFPSALILFPESLISIQRIQDFLLHNQIMSEPLDKTTNNFARTADKCIMKSYHVSEKKFTGVTITDLSFKWDKSLTKYIFNSENFNVCAGEIVGVVGSAGSGKSTLLQIILREVDCIKGSIEVGGSISYASQDPWIFSASVRQNILFGEELDLEKYNKIVKVCGLEHDVDVLPYGDQTLVGERGIMLSGGQKARINLARAVYRDADIYLLDDPLSAVDVQVARQIFDECILKYLKNKCVVLVTHQIQYLANVNKIYLLESGKIIHSEERESTADLKNRIAGDVQKSTETSRARFFKERKLPFDLKEHRSSGNTDKKIYKAYCSAAGHCSFTCVVLFLFAVVQLFASFIDYFVAVWIDPDQKTTSLNSKFLNILDTKNRLYIYAGLLAVFVLISHAASLLFVTYCTKASIKLHNTMLFRIVHATMTFFNHHSSGRILNRFSKDMGCTDEALPVMLMNVIAAAFAIININVIVIITNYWMIIPASLLLGVSYFLVTIFHPLNRNLRRTEGTSKCFTFVLTL